MEHKYYNRAIEILGDELFIVDGELYIDTGGNVIIDAMCQLAEEVEASKILNTVTKEDVDKLSKSYENCIGIYTKEQVEELLDRQRKLCAKEAIIKEECHEYGVSSFIDDYSILNAKLKLE